MLPVRCFFSIIFSVLCQLNFLKFTRLSQSCGEPGHTQFFGDITGFNTGVCLAVLPNFLLYIFCSCIVKMDVV